MRTNRFIAVLILVTASLSRGGAVQASVVLLDTFGPGNAVSGAGFGTQTSLRVAMPFSVSGTSPLTLTSITVALIEGAPASRILLVGSVGGVPQPMNLETFHIPSHPFGSLDPAVVTVTATQKLLLQPGGQFWLVWEGPFACGTSPLNSQLARSQASNGTWMALGASDPAIRATADSAGACCNDTTGSCTLVSGTVCSELGLTYRGDGIACSSATCAPPVLRGACCISAPEPRCLIRTASECSQAGGTYFGTGTACPPPGNPNLCCPADFNGSESISVQDIFSFLGAYFAGCP